MPGTGVSKSVPLAMRTCPSGSRVAVWFSRPAVVLPVLVQVLVSG